MTNDTAKSLLLRLSSGKQLVVTRILLFPEPEFQQIIKLRTKAHEEMGGFSTGVGFLGSPGWVFTGVAVLGFIESLLSSSKIKKAYRC